MEITRGDFKSFKFKRQNKQKQDITTTPDKMYITFKYSNNSNEVLFQKTYGTTSVTPTITYNAQTHYYSFNILPSDTDDLEYGEYTYDIEIIINNNQPITIKKGILTITDETTTKRDEVE